MADKPTAAFVLSLIGAIIYLVVGLFVAVVATAVGAFAGLVVPMAGLAIAAVGGIGLVSGIIMIIGAAMMNSSDKSRVRTGSVLVLVFTLVGAFFTAGGILIGFVLGLVGSILGLTWKPSGVVPPPPTPPA